MEQIKKCACCSPADKMMRGALLATRFQTYEELKSVVKIVYADGAYSDSAVNGSMALVRHCSNGVEISCLLTEGITQQDMWNARYDKKWKRFSARLALLFRSPWVIANRKDLQRVYTLSRWRPEWFGEGDVAFYDIAKATAANINTPGLAYKNERDTTDKGYLNSFNHLTAQAFVTSCFSQQMADFIADAHERYSHPEIISGNFTDAQILDVEEGPLDNYVDVINNEWGQELGIQLKQKYSITRETIWTPALLANYLNDMQSYFSWAFQIGFKPFRAEDEIVQKFSRKMQRVMKDTPG